MHWLLAWILVGAIVQLVALIELRIKWGGRSVDVAHKAMGMTWWVRLAGLALWPIDLLGRLIPVKLLLQVGDFQRFVTQVNESVNIDARERCPECGEAWLTHPEGCR